MGNSFQDQLLKAGLVNKKQVNKARHEKKITRQQNKGKKTSENQSEARQKKLVLEQRTRELNRRQNEEKMKQEKLAQARHLIETNRLPLDDHGEPYYFPVGKKIKRLFVSQEMTEQLSRGQLAIVKINDNYEVVTAKAAKQIAGRDREALVVFYETSKNGHAT